MKNFVAIDFETANGNRASVCSVGIVIVKNGKIINKLYRLIRPFQTTIPNGQQRFMGLPLRIQKKLKIFLRYGLK